MITTEPTYRAAEDRFEVYFAEKFWEMIPEIYRYEDALGDNPGVLRSMVEILARQAAILRRSQDRLWEDQFIELCNDWAVPYLADLVGTRLLSAQNPRGRRIDVAKTIYYRRRKGTLRILEELISDITGWEGRVVENFRRLGRSRHGLDPFPQTLAAPLSGSLPGGWADLRQQRASELSNGSFDEYHHTADIRRHRGEQGRYGIPKLAFHLYRLQAYRVENSTPFSLEDGVSFSFDPSGREIPLFARRNRDEQFDWEAWRSIYEWELPLPIRCRLLAHAEFELDGEAIATLVADFGLPSGPEAELEKLRGVHFKSESRLRQTMEASPFSGEFTAQPFFLALLRESLVDACGKNALLPASIEVRIPDEEGSSVPAEEIVAGNLFAGATTFPAAPEKTLVIDPENGRFRSLDGATAEGAEVSYAYGFSGGVGAGTYDRRYVEEGEPAGHLQGGGELQAADLDHLGGVSQIDDSKTYGPLPNKNSISDLTLQAANQQRPYLRMEGNWRLSAGTHEDSLLTLDGLWIGSGLPEEGGDPYEIRIVGDYECVVIRHCTLDPGGATNIAGDPVLPVALVIEGTVEQLLIDHSITGPILTRGTGLLEELVICDSLIQSVDAGVAAIDMEDANARIERTTIFGSVQLHRLEASEVLMTDLATITDTQSGCFRFSVAPSGSRLPRPYPHPLLSFSESNHWFTSRVFGNPGYGQLSETAPQELQRGAENGSEIGVFSSLINPIKLDGLKTKVEEYMPFGLIPLYIKET